jgi:hypothetical protein
MTATTRITVNTDGTQPHIYLSTDLTTYTNLVPLVSALDVICLTDVTINNSTGIYSFVDFCTTDMNKLTTPADNSVSSNMVLDKNAFFGTNGTGPTAPEWGVNGLASSKTKVQFVVTLNGPIDTTGTIWYQGTGFITDIAPTVTPDAPVWVSPMTIAVTGPFTQGENV